LIQWDGVVSIDDQRSASALDDARSVVHDAGASELGPRPWQGNGQPPSDGDLVRFAAWAASRPDADPQVLGAGLGLLASARAELDQVEAALLFAARAAGMTFQEIGQALGLGSGQAAQQRMSRVLARLDEA
jgi:hypothetical protein